MTAAERQHRWRVGLAFGLVYFFWGSTYLGIRIAVEHIPAPLAMGVRFAVAGPLLLAVCKLQGRRLAVARRDWLRLAAIGLLLLTGGNMVVAWSEQSVASGLAALIVAVVPLWVALIEAGILKGERLHGRGFLGLALGIGGLLVLLWPELRAPGTLGRRELLGCLTLIAASLSWASGSVLSRRSELKVDAFVAAGWETTIGGVANLAIALALGDHHRAVWTLRGAGAIVYLIIFGSWVGFSAYTWLLNHVPTAKVATYAYVNPVVAVFLGWLVLSEAVTGYILAGTVVIIAAVALVNSSKVQARAPTAPQPRPEEMPAYEPGAD